MKILVSALLILSGISAGAADFGINDSWDQATSHKPKKQIENYDISGLNKYVSRDQFGNSSSLSLQGQIITVDTENKATCFRIRQMLIEKAKMTFDSLKNLCSSDGGRYVSIVRMTPTDFEFSRTPTIGDQIEKFQFLGVGMMGVIAALPPELSNWGDDIWANALDKWRTNVTTPPVIDQDDWMINYIGHPISGAAYYIMARQTGFGAAGSFGFSVMMSTFFWEYGLEAFAEKPSIQDLILTPTLGALLGEAMYRGNDAIRGNDNKILGSSALGKVGLVVTDPVGALIKGLTKLGNNRYLYNGQVTWTGIPFEGPAEKIYIAPGVVLHLNFGPK